MAERKMLAAIIQARMTSSRLPGKVLKPIGGRPVLAYMIERLRSVSRIAAAIVATTTNREDDPIVSFCKSEGVACFRGSEEDVLERFYQTAQHYRVDDILRLTADCPLIDPAAIDLAIDAYTQGGHDFVYLGLSFAEGICLDLFSFRALERAYHNARTTPQREHVTPYFHDHLELFRILGLENTTDDSKYRFVLDEPEDFEVIEAIVTELYREGERPFDAQAIKAFLDAHPEIYAKNAHIVRNQSYDVFQQKSQES
jgi:spore coat polysaccharide biosynthesis protein SpsF